MRSSFLFSFVLLLRPLPTSTLFPYTTLFRSEAARPAMIGLFAELCRLDLVREIAPGQFEIAAGLWRNLAHEVEDRKSTRLNSSHLGISYAVFCLKKKK